jgi:hypothetical protein
MALASKSKTTPKAQSRSNTGFGLLAPRKFNKASESFSRGHAGSVAKKVARKVATSTFPRNAASITKSIGSGEYAAPNSGYTTKMNKDKQQFGGKSGASSRGSKGGRYMRAYPSDSQLTDHV